MGNCIICRSHKLDNLFVIIDYNKLQGLVQQIKFKFRTFKIKISKL